MFEPVRDLYFALKVQDPGVKPDSKNTPEVGMEGTSTVDQARWAIAFADEAAELCAPEIAYDISPCPAPEPTKSIPHEINTKALPLDPMVTVTESVVVVRSVKLDEFVRSLVATAAPAAPETICATAASVVAGVVIAANAVKSESSGCLSSSWV